VEKWRIRRRLRRVDFTVVESVSRRLIGVGTAQNVLPQASNMQKSILCYATKLSAAAM